MELIDEEMNSASLASSLMKGPVIALFAVFDILWLSPYATVSTLLRTRERVPLYDIRSNAYERLQLLNVLPCHVTSKFNPVSLHLLTDCFLTSTIRTISTQLNPYASRKGWVRLRLSLCRYVDTFNRLLESSSVPR